MSQEQAMANVPQQERCNIARIGFFGKGRMTYPKKT